MLSTVEPSLVVSIPPVYNEFGSVRLSLTQSFYKLKRISVGNFLNKKNEYVSVKAWVLEKELTKVDLDDIIRIYCEYRDTEEVVPIKYVFKSEEIWDCNLLGINPDKYISYLDTKGVKASHYGIEGWISREVETNEWSFPVACKRGNETYVDITKKRLAPLLCQEPLFYFDTAYNSKRRITRYTNMLYVTGTTDPDKRTIGGAWLSFPRAWNSFITNLRKQFGELVFIRSWQSQKNGYPHFHAIIYFNSVNFSVVPNFGNEGLSWRISSRQKLHKRDKLTIRQRLKEAWQWGHLDIVCISDTQGCFKDLLKYVLRDLEGGESDLTNAMIWFFGKHSFGFSRNFIEKIWGKKEPVALQEPCNADLIYPLMCNSNPKPVRIEIYPTVKREFVLKKPVRAWQQDINLGVDPPPKEAVDDDFLVSLTCGYELRRVEHSKFSGIPVYVWTRRRL